MTIFTDVLKELVSMFMADARLTAAVLILVSAISLWLKLGPGFDTVIPGFALLAGCIVIIIAVTTAHARRSK